MNADHAVSGAAAFAAVIKQWQDGVIPPTGLADPPFARLSAALVDERASILDRLVLLRHALRYESLRREGTVHVLLPGPVDHRVAELGLAVHPHGSAKVEVSALPWAPTWLEDGRKAVDETAMRAVARRFGIQQGPRADPYLRSLRRETYRSVTQQAAIRAVVSMPPGASLVIDLPTGEGKSTAFQVLASAGFAASAAGRTPGLVVVIVPTVTLALDHERTCGGGEEHPMAYVGGREACNGTIREAIRLGTQKLVFAAPEAAVKSLRAPLAKVAQEGGLGAIVVDEAHLIDGWGTGFRTEFQTLAGVLNSWRGNSPVEQAFRTVFLSATFDDASVQTLQDLFSPKAPIPAVSGARIRPEPEYWVANATDDATRARRVEEALRHLPRPAILYVTRVSDAEWWSENLRRQGYSRVALMHGGTSTESREEILRCWNDGKIDIVVATSAFGLGIDYPHVRTVIHACLPETLNRFYQEIGRGGRDGCASISLLIPQLEDAQIARSLSSKKVITVDRGLTRWRAMFQHQAAICEGHPFYAVPLDIPPGYDIDDIDLVGERSTDWNQRTLALMARSGLIRLMGAHVRDASDEPGPRQFERLEVTDEGHLEFATWRVRVEPTREEIATQGSRAFELLTRFATGRECPARLMARLYGGRDRQVALVCSGCRVCRADPTAQVPEGSVPYCRSPWPIQGALAPALETLWGTPRYAVVTYPLKSPGNRVVRDFVEALRRLDTYGLRIWVEVGDLPTWMREAADKALVGKPWVVQTSDMWAPMMWPDGARLIACSLEATPSAKILSSGALASPRLVLILKNTPDPTQPGRDLSDVVAGPVYDFQNFLSVVLQ